MNRRLLLGLGGLLLVVVVAAGITLGLLDTIVRRRIEQRGSALTGTAVRVGEVDIALASGRATLHALSVANPPGFTAPHALMLDGVEVRVDLLSLFSDPLVIDTVRIGAPRVFYEVDAQGRSNIDALRDAVEGRGTPPAPPPPAGAPAAIGTPPPTATPLVASAPPTPAAPRPAGRRRERRLIVHLFELREGEATLDFRATGGQLRTEELPPFELTAIGVREGGATPKEVGRTILAAVARDVAIAVAANELEKLVGKDIGGPLGELLKKGGSSAIGQGLGGVLDAVLGKKKKPVTGDQ